MKNYTHTLNEGFNSYFKKLNEESNSDFEELKNIFYKKFLGEILNEFNHSIKNRADKEWEDADCYIKYPNTMHVQIVNEPCDKWLYADCPINMDIPVEQAMENCKDVILNKLKDSYNESLNEEDEELPINYLEDDLRSDVYNALSDIAFKYHQKGVNITEDEMDKAIEWFQLHFWEIEDLNEE